MIKTEEFEIQGKEESRYIKVLENTQKIIKELEMNLEINREIEKFLLRRIEETKI